MICELRSGGRRLSPFNLFRDAALVILDMSSPGYELWHITLNPRAPLRLFGLLRLAHFQRPTRRPNVSGRPSPDSVRIAKLVRTPNRASSWKSSIVLDGPK
jgi:hypothetical protein